MQQQEEQTWQTSDNSTAVLSLTHTYTHTGDLERERLNSMRATAREVEHKWQTSVNSTALQHTRDLWKIGHGSVEPKWGAVGGHL